MEDHFTSDIIFSLRHILLLLLTFGHTLYCDMYICLSECLFSGVVRGGGTGEDRCPWVPNIWAPVDWGEKFLTNDTSAQSVQSQSNST